MKKATKTTLRIILTAVFVPLAIWQICLTVLDFKTRGAELALFDAFLMFFSILFFVFSMFSWIAPRAFFNICWKLSGILRETYDYDTGLARVDSMSLSFLIVALVGLGIGLLVIPI